MKHLLEAWRRFKVSAEARDHYYFPELPEFIKHEECLLGDPFVKMTRSIYDSFTEEEKRVLHVRTIVEYANEIENWLENQRGVVVIGKDRDVVAKSRETKKENYKLIPYKSEMREFEKKYGDSFAFLFYEPIVIEEVSMPNKLRTKNDIDDLVNLSVRHLE